MPRVYEEKNLTLSFSDTEDMDEIQVVRDIFRKFDSITKKAGFKKDFTPTETDFIRAISLTINKPLKDEST